MTFTIYMHGDGVNIGLLSHICWFKYLIWDNLGHLVYNVGSSLDTLWDVTIVSS